MFTNLISDFSSFKVNVKLRLRLINFVIFGTSWECLDLNEQPFDTLSVKNHSFKGPPSWLFYSPAHLFIIRLTYRKNSAAHDFFNPRSVSVDDEADRSHRRNLSPVPLLPWFSTGLSRHRLAFNPHKKRGMAAFVSPCAPPLPPPKGSGGGGVLVSRPCGACILAWRATANDDPG